MCRFELFDLFFNAMNGNGKSADMILLFCFCRRNKIRQ